MNGFKHKHIQQTLSLSDSIKPAVVPVQWIKQTPNILDGWAICKIINQLNIIWFVVVMVFNATFNNISVITWQSVLLVEETRVPWENHKPVASHWQTLSYNVALSTPRLSGIRTHNISSCKPNYHTNMTTAVPV
jgi:hypothetical protein